MENRNSQKGQTLIIAVVVMVVVLTVGLAVISRTVTNLKISRQSDESQRAFQAAEAGIEKALKEQVASTITSGSGNLGNFASFTYEITAASGAELLLNDGKEVMQTKGIDVWLSNYPDYSGKFNGAIDIHWWPQSVNCNVTEGSDVVPALEIIILEGADINNPTMKKYFFDRCRTQRANGADDPRNSSVNIDSLSFRLESRIPGTDNSISVTNGIIMRVIPIYNSTRVGITSSASLPAQGKVIESSGISGDTQRKLRYFVSYPQIPSEIFPYSIVAQGYDAL